MKIMYERTLKKIEIDEIDRVIWLDGASLYYKLPKDNRPELSNPYDKDDCWQIYYQLHNLAKQYPINQTPVDIAEALENLKALATLYSDYANHTLGLIIKDIK